MGLAASRTQFSGWALAGALLMPARHRHGARIPVKFPESPCGGCVAVH
jgi:hypothetical protein